MTDMLQETARLDSHYQNLKVDRGGQKLAFKKKKIEAFRRHMSHSKDQNLLYHSDTNPEIQSNWR